jgi:TorA maturation chaperone TorD
MTSTDFTSAAVSRLAVADLLLLLSSFFKNRLRARARFQERDLDAEALVGAAGFSESSATALRELLSVARNTDAEIWAAEHNRLFEAGVACPPNETALIRRDKGGILADIQGFYTAFGLRPSPVGAERPDHISCEFDFLALLLVMSETATQKGDAEAAEVASDAARAFARDHLSEWVPLFCEALDRTTAEPLFVALARALATLWDDLSELLEIGAKPLPERAILPPQQADDSGCSTGCSCP